MKIYLIDKTTIHSLYLPNKIEGQYVLSNGSGVKLEIEGIDDFWYLKSNSRNKVLGEKKEVLTKCIIKEHLLYIVDDLVSNEVVVVYAEPVTEDRIEFDKYVPNTNVISIGRSKENDVSIDSTYASLTHAEMLCDNGIWRIKDLESSNGTFVNGKRIIEEELSLGDVVFIMGLIIIVGNGFFALNNPDQSIIVNDKALNEYNAQIILPQENEDELEVKQDYFYRSPRFKRDIEKAEFKLDSPPNNQNGDEMPLMMTIGPSMTMGMASMATAVYGVMQGNMISVVTSGCMLLGTILWPIISKKYEKRRKVQKEYLRQVKYKEYLERVKQTFNDECIKQKEILLENNISIDECKNRIFSVSRNLWERSYAQNDFLEICIGKGTVPMQANIEYPERRFEVERDSLEEELLDLCEAPHVIENVPITVSLYDNYITGVIGPRRDTFAFSKGLLTQLSTLYSYDELKFVFIYDENKDEENFEYLKWFPHIWNDEKTFRFLARNVEDVKSVSQYLELEFESRKDLKEDELADSKPYYMIFVYDRELSLRADILRKIYESKKNMNFTVLSFFNELKDLPKECGNVIDVCNDEGELYNKNDISGKTISFVPDIYINGSIADLCIKMSNINLYKVENEFVLPKMMTFLEMYKVGKIEHLNILDRWKENNPIKSLEAQIGVDTNGDEFKLDLHEKNHGPHGLIAGMTGSGKSEFIMTYILSLAINYHPNEVSFVLIDYKGGGMAKAFEKLPHTAGIITNLDGSSINRSLISIQSELRRREMIFAELSKECGVSNIDIYKYQGMYREGIAKEPLQHLFIISDEFAELKTQQPEFMTQLVSAARIGRSLGVHLILATQKPSGVVDDQIWSNARFKACLKVQDRADSMDMLKRPEAAELQETGRFFLQVGYNELFKLGQSAWAGAPYYPSDKAEKNEDDSIDIIDNVGRIVASAKVDKKKTFSKPKKQIDAITDYLSEIAIHENISIRPLWLEPIPPIIYIDDIQNKYDWIKEDNVINPIIGEFDDPMNQRQAPLCLQLTENGNTVVYGMAGSGKTTFLTSMIYSMLKNYTPDEVNIYIIDLAAETLRAFMQAPHVGDVVLGYEDEKVKNLIKLLLGQIQSRKKIFADYGGDIKNYNKNSDSKVPSIVVSINNYAAFNELYDEYEDDMLLLTREGPKYGIYFIMTASGTNVIRFRMAQNIGQSFALQLTDETDYAAIVGKNDGLIPQKCKGRGLCKREFIYEFQTAYAFEEENQFMQIKEYCDELRVKYSHYKAKSIPVLPEKVNVEFIEQYIDIDSLVIPIGIETNTLEASFLELENNYISFIQSNNKEYLSFMNALIALFDLKYKLSLNVFDLNTSLDKSFNDRGISYYTGANKIGEGIDSFFDIVLERHNAIKDAETEERDMPVFERQVFIINDLSSLREALNDEQSNKLSLALEKGTTRYNVFVVISDISSMISTYNFEKWFVSNSLSNNGVWVGSGINEQYNLKLTKTSRELNDELSEEYGYLVKNGKANRVKVLNEKVE